MRIAVCFLLFSSIIRYIRTKNTKKKFESNCSPRASLSGVGAPAALGSANMRRKAERQRSCLRACNNVRARKKCKENGKFLVWVNFLPKLFCGYKENA